MAKKGASEFVCQSCGAVYPKWQGKCDACGEWNTIVEEKVGGEGFIMQKISGHGLAFLEFDGSVIEYVLQPGQQIVVDTGYLAAMEATCNMEIRTVPGIKNMMFGGEGLFNTVITGPGRVWLQTMPISNVAGAIMKVFPAR